MRTKTILFLGGGKYMCSERYRDAERNNDSKNMSINGGMLVTTMNR